MSKLLTTLAVTLLGTATSFAAGDGPHQLPLYSESVFGKDSPLFFITNSMIMVWIAVAIIVGFSFLSTRKMAMIPSGLQNFAEWLVESLYNFFGGILGEHLVKRTFWFYGSTFILVLIVNYLGLIPGVGTIYKEYSDGSILPYMRGGNADLNMTAAMSVTFALLWFYWAITENGFKGFIAHIFAPKGNFTGIMKFGMIGIFFIVGLLEVVSIAVRPLALSFRLFGNIFGGEQTLEGLMYVGSSIGGDWMSFLPALPFMFIELLVGLVQALVFTLLSAVFLKLICEHDDHGEEHH